jgi:hypothetical protein
MRQEDVVEFGADLWGLSWARAVLRMDGWRTYDVPGVIVPSDCCEICIWMNKSTCLAQRWHL